MPFTSFTPSSPANWLEATYLSLTAGSSWTMPVGMYSDCSAYMNAFILAQIDYLSTSGGTLTIEVQSAPIMSNDASAWQTVATVSSISTTGPQVIKVLRTATYPITGLLRLKVTAVTATVTFTIRAELLQKSKVPTRTLDWLAPTYISLATSGTWTMPMSHWLDTSGFVNAWLLCDFRASSGSGADLTVTLQTAPALSVDTDAWLTVGSAITLGTTPATYDARSSVTNPPMALLRLKLDAAAGLAGTLRVQVLQKAR